MSSKHFIPVSSRELLDTAMNRLYQAGLFPFLKEDEMKLCQETLSAVLPEWYLPDVFLDLPLSGTGSSCMAVVLDCNDRHAVNYETLGAYYQNIPYSVMCEMDDEDKQFLLKADPKGVQASAETFLFDPLSSFTGLPPVLSDLFDLPILACRKKRKEDVSLILKSKEDIVGKGFLDEEIREAVTNFLLLAGCTKEKTDLLRRASITCGIPYDEKTGKRNEWLLRTDIAAILITIRKGEITDCHAIVRISDRCMRYLDLSMKPVRAYQWHITDTCDQRCRHCYLFAEDAQKSCVSMSLNEMKETLDAIEDDAKERSVLPLLAITGGDPLLHPDFWRLAKAIYERGWRWMIMGNPYHLSKEVCRKLYHFGCIKYQLSLDGLKEFHDAMRKPGSFEATLQAVSLLNEAGIRSQWMATVSRRNMEDVLACMDIAADHKVGYFVFSRYCATTKEKADEYPSPNEYREFLIRYYSKAREYKAKGCTTEFQFKEHLFVLLRYELKEFEIPSFAKRYPDVIFQGCHIGQTCCILPNGDVMACRHMNDSVIGNLFQKRLHEILTGERNAEYFEIRKIRKCRDCELLCWCRGCRAVGVNASGDLQSEDPCCWKEKEEDRL